MFVCLSVCVCSMHSCVHACMLCVHACMLRACVRACMFSVCVRVCILYIPSYIINDLLLTCYPKCKFCLSMLYTRGKISNGVLFLLYLFHMILILYQYAIPYTILSLCRVEDCPFLGASIQMGMMFVFLAQSSLLHIMHSD